MIEGCLISHGLRLKSKGWLGIIVFAPKILPFLRYLLNNTKWREIGGTSTQRRIANWTKIVVRFPDFVSWICACKENKLASTFTKYWWMSYTQVKIKNASAARLESEVSAQSVRSQQAAAGAVFFGLRPRWSLVYTAQYIFFILKNAHS